MPEMSPPPPMGTTTMSRYGYLLQQLQADGALAGDDQRVVEGVDEDAVLAPAGCARASA